MSSDRANLARPTLRRSVNLFRAFRREQSDPTFFYRTLAEDSVRQLQRYTTLEASTVVDVGGGPGFFAEAFGDAGARYYWVEADPEELRSHGLSVTGAVQADGARLPFRDGCVDVCYSSNVLEHVSRPWQLADEMLRVTRRGGLAFVSFTVWLGPWGGHETAPWHYLGGERAARHYERVHGRPPKNRFGRSLFPVSVVEALGWAAEVERDGRAELLDAFPRYAPSWARGVLRVPVVREVVTWNLAMALLVR